MSQGIAAAKAKNVPVFQQDGLTEAKGPANGLYSQPDGTSDWLNKGKLSANFAISTTDAKAKVLMVNVEAFDVLALYEKSMKAELSAKCPDCSLTALGVQYADVIGSKVPALTVNYLRSHPEINYVIFPTGGFGTGFVQAATTAGIKIGKGGVQLAYQAPNDTNRQEIIDGKSVGALSTPNPYNGWVIVDAMARQSIGDPLTVNWKSPTPLLIQTKATTKNAKDEYTGPTGYEAAFKALWKI